MPCIHPTSLPPARARPSPSLTSPKHPDLAPNPSITSQTSGSQPALLLLAAHVNQMPVIISPLNFTGDEDTPLSTPAPGLLSGLTDPDGGTLEALPVTNQPTHNGTVTIEANGAFTYTPDESFNGQDSFNFTVVDGQGGVATGIALVAVGE